MPWSASSYLQDWRVTQTNDGGLENVVLVVAPVVFALQVLRADWATVETVGQSALEAAQFRQQMKIGLVAALVTGTLDPHHIHAPPEGEQDIVDDPLM